MDPDLESHLPPGAALKAKEGNFTGFLKSDNGILLKASFLKKIACIRSQAPSPSVKIQIMGGKVCFRCKGKTLLGIVNKLLKTKSLLTSTSNVLPSYLK